MRPQCTLHNFLLFREHSFSISSCMTKYLVCSTKFWVNRGQLLRSKGWREASAANQMANSLSFGTNAFSTKWPWFCLSAYLVVGSMVYIRSSKIYESKSQIKTMWLWQNFRNSNNNINECLNPIWIRGQINPMPILGQKTYKHENKIGDIF